MNARARRCAGLMLAALHLGGCTTWRATTVDPGRFIEDQRPWLVRVTRADGARVRVPEPRIVRDSIAVVRGTCRPSVRGYDCPTRGLVALEDVAALEERVADTGRTLLLVVPVIALGIFALAYEAAWNDLEW